jgi:hypothetical protein
VITVSDHLDASELKQLGKLPPEITVSEEYARLRLATLPARTPPPQ